MAYVSGTRGTANINTNGVRKYDHSDKLYLVDPDYAVLAFFARKLAKQGVIDPEYRWFEKTQPSRQDAVNAGGGYTTGATDIVVDDSSKFRTGDIVVNVRSGEHYNVTGITSVSNTLTVGRAFGTTVAATLSDNDVLVILGNANAEGAAIRTPLSNITDKKTNYTQIFREPFSVTGTDESTELYGGNDISQLRLEHLQLHMKDIERAFLFGEPKEDTSGTQPVRATGGANYFISTNVKSVATLTSAEFEAWVKDLFSKGGDKKLAFVSPLIASAVNSYAAGKLVMYPTDKTYGISIAKYLSIHGQLDFVIERLLAENSTWGGMAFAFDMSLVGYRFLNGNGKSRDTKLLKDRQTAGTDEIKEEYLSEIGFWMTLENRHGVLKGVTAYS